MSERVDVVVVGGGNAGFSAAHAAAARGRQVVLLEKGRADERGGNSYYTAGAFRIAHGGIADVAPILAEQEIVERSNLAPYPAAAFVDDLMALTDGRSDPDLARVLAEESREALDWLHGIGIRFRLMHERQAYPDPQEAGRLNYFGGLAIGAVGGGKGLMADHEVAAEKAGVSVRFGAAATDLVVEDGAVRGVVWHPVDDAADPCTLYADSVILAAGGFEADAESRREYLGAGWERAKVRGTPLNTGEMLRSALRIGAGRAGDWSSCHSVAWEAWGADIESNRALTNQLTRGGYPLGIVVNQLGQRFLDEGADFRNYTYAKYGAEILAQPGGQAFQVFDSTTRAMLRSEEYDASATTELVADTVVELAELAGVPADDLRTTVEQFNSAIDTAQPFDPSRKDGRRAELAVPKSNWAMALDTPPFHAFPVTCGITFTFGGLRSDLDGRVLDTEGAPMPGLFVCGEMLGGLFSGNYPGGSGLTAGTVFGRRAGASA